MPVRRPTAISNGRMNKDQTGLFAEAGNWQFHRKAEKSDRFPASYKSSGSKQDGT